MSDLTSKYATIRVHYGEGKKHLYGAGESPMFFHTKAEAYEYAEDYARNGHGMAAVLKLESLFRGVMTVEEIKA